MDTEKVLIMALFTMAEIGVLLFLLFYSGFATMMAGVGVLLMATAVQRIAR